VSWDLGATCFVRKQLGIKGREFSNEKQFLFSQRDVYWLKGGEMSIRAVLSFTFVR
jgi:hypothetical protein